MFSDVLKVSRPGFWPTHVWFYVLPFAERNMFGSWAFWIGACYVCLPLSLLLYGWNDVGDAETDAMNPRKDSWLFGARPDDQLRARLPLIIALVQLPFVAAFVCIAGFKMLGLMVLIVLANFLYNTAGFKKLPVLDLLNQVGYVLMFVLASWLCDVPQLNVPAIVFGALFAMQSHLFGQLMDLDEDRAALRRSTAIVIGVTAAKFLLAAIMLAAATIGLCFFRGYYVAIFMGAGSLFFFVDAIFGPDRYPLWFVKAFFVGWNCVVLVTIHLIWRYGFFLLK